jgi:hypothetical protein
MPTLNLSELNVVVAVLGAFATIYGIISVKIKQAWYLGEARKLFPEPPGVKYSLLTRILQCRP